MKKISDMKKISNVKKTGDMKNISNMNKICSLKNIHELKKLKQNEIKYTNKTTIKKVWVLLILTLLLLGITASLYWIENRIPSGILLDDAEVEELQDKFKQMNIQITPYLEAKEFNHNNVYQIHVSEKYEDTLYYSLQQRYPESYIRNLSMEGHLRLQTIELIWVLLILGLIFLVFKYATRRWRTDYDYVFHIISFFIIAIFVKYRVILPASWIPNTLIDVKSWVHNIRNYYVQLYQLGVTPCMQYQQYLALHHFLVISSGIGLVVFLILHKLVCLELFSCER